jgi:hypothetical protein
VRVPHLPCSRTPRTPGPPLHPSQHAPVPALRRALRTLVRAFFSASAQLRLHTRTARVSSAPTRSRAPRTGACSRQLSSASRPRAAPAHATRAAPLHPTRHNRRSGYRARPILSACTSSPGIAIHLPSSAPDLHCHNCVRLHAARFFPRLRYSLAALTPHSGRAARRPQPAPALARPNTRARLGRLQPAPLALPGRTPPSFRALPPPAPISARPALGPARPRAKPPPGRRPASAAPPARVGRSPAAEPSRRSPPATPARPAPNAQRLPL